MLYYHSKPTDKIMSRLSNPDLTRALVILFIPVSLVFLLTCVETENDYFVIIPFYLFMVSAVLFVTWKLFKGLPGRRGWLVFAILFLIAYIFVQLMALYVMALGKAFQH